MDLEATLNTYLAGHRLIETQKRDYDWAFCFGDGPLSGLSVSSAWRILIDGKIAFAGTDDGHKFGLPTPLNGEEMADRLLGQKVIEHVSLRPGTGDLSIIFSGNAVLEILNMSSGYESWQIGLPGMTVIGAGGGEVVFYSEGGKS